MKILWSFLRLHWRVIVLFFGVVNNLLTIFPRLQKSCQFRCMSFIFTKLTFFLSGNHSQVFSVHTGFISPSLIAALTWNRAAAMWLQVEPVPAMQVQWALKIFPIFCKATICEANLSVFPKVCSLLLENNALTLLHGMIFFKVSPVLKYPFEAL